MLANAEGTNGAAMRATALELIERLPAEAVVLPVQTLGELFNVLVRFGGAGGVRRGRLSTLLSKDLQDGFTWRGVTVTNPFSATTHPLLAALLTPRER